ncbi:TPA: hypothetical protein U6303_003025 [Legionella pneumophila]|nr:hypothetical protein [Legionella pneumophila]HDV5764808.1 hypothetical protein [Legionella pneumophila]HEN5542545.1 hypothetical protein [Legionella pneumophila]HEN5548937.1 hypothetical protein [Legionella pneumophila]
MFVLHFNKEFASLIDLVLKAMGLGIRSINKIIENARNAKKKNEKKQRVKRKIY